MKRIIWVLFMVVCSFQSWAQYQASTSRTWDKYPPEVQKPGFGMHMYHKVQMDDDLALEEVYLFTADNGHYPDFDIFRVYYVIIDNYTKEVKYISDITLTTEKVLLLEDRNQDGKYELYRRYFQDDKFRVDEAGNNLSVTWVYDRIEWIDDKITINTKKR